MVVFAVVAILTTFIIINDFTGQEVYRYKQFEKTQYSSKFSTQKYSNY